MPVSPSAPATLSAAEWRRIAIAGYAPTLLSSIGYGCVIPLVASSAIDRGATVSLAAFMVSLQALGQLSFDLPAGWIADRLGDKRAMTIACGVDFVTLGVAAVTHSLLVLGIAVLCVGMTGAIFSLARQAYLTEAVPLHTRARALSTLGGTFRIGWFVGPLIGGFIVARWGLHPAWGFASGMSLLAMIVTILIPDVETEAQRVARANAQPVTHERLFDVLRSKKKTLLTIGVGCMMIQMMRAARQSILPVWCVHNGIDAATTDFIYAAAMLCEVLMFFPGGYVMDRLGRWWVCVPSMAVMGTATMVLAFMHTRPQITAVAMVLALANGVASGIVMTLSSDHSPALGRPQFLSGMRLLGDSGAALAPLTLTWMSALFAPWIAVLALGSVGWIGALWLNRWIPRRPLRPRPGAA